VPDPRQLVVIDGGYATITAARAHAVEEGLILVDAFLVFGGRAVEDVLGAIAGREPVTGRFGRGRKRSIVGHVIERTEGPR